MQLSVPVAAAAAVTAAVPLSRIMSSLQTSPAHLWAGAGFLKSAGAPGQDIRAAVGSRLWFAAEMCAHHYVKASTTLSRHVGVK
jgi:hypothetical protein